MDSPPEQVAGLPLVDRPRMSAEDVEILREYLGTRRQKLARSGLRLGSFSEHPSPDMYEGLGAAARWLPATYLIRATRP